jgi:hypothetical protein
VPRNHEVQFNHQQAFTTHGAGTLVSNVKDRTEMPQWLVPLLVGIAIPAVVFFLGSLTLLVLWLLVG